MKDIVAGPAPGAADGTGDWHQPDHIDATNVRLYGDGTFTWGIFGCDFGGGGGGIWQRSGTATIDLLPAVGAKTFYWPGAVSFKNAVQVVHWQRLSDGTVQASGTDDGSPFQQVWLGGSVCATCGGNLGPSDLPKACTNPYLP